MTYNVLMSTLNPTHSLTTECHSSYNIYYIVLHDRVQRLALMTLLYSGVC